MAITLNTFLTKSIFLMFAASVVSTQLPNNTAITDFTQTADSPSTCRTYLTYRVKLPYSDLGSISNLFGISKMDIAMATNLASEDLPLITNELLLIPITCASNGSHYFSNVTYKIEKDESFYSVSIKQFQNLTNFILVEEKNPTLNPNNLTVGAEIIVPLLCKCVRNSSLEKGINYLITYVWQPNDDISPVSNMFQAEESDIIMGNNNRNFTASICLPVLIPVKKPLLLQHYASPILLKKHKHHPILVTILTISLSLMIVFAGLAVYFRILYTKRKIFARTDSSLETSDLIKPSKSGESFEKMKQDKLLPGVSGYLGRTVMYDVHVIMKATMNLNERFKIGGSVYKAMINDQVFAIKETRDANEELQILQRVNHANLVKLMGVSSDNEGNRFIVYEYADNGSLDKYLFPKVTTGWLSWNQRLFIALDIAYGLQYMHEHSQPSIVHKDIHTSNILLDSNFKAKISNFSSARAADCAIALDVDVFSFGIVLLELLSGKKVMELKETGEILMLWKDIKDILEIEIEEERRERLRKWMDPKLQNTFPLDDALSLAILGRACTSENSSERPRMGEVVFNLCVLTQSSMYEKPWITKFEDEEVFSVMTPVKAR